MIFKNTDVDFSLVIIAGESRRICRGRIQEFILGGQTKVPNRKLRAKPESRERSARELRAKPEPRAKPEKKRGRGLGRGLGQPLPRKFLKNQTWNHFGAYLKQLFEMTNEMDYLPTFMKNH